MTTEGAGSGTGDEDEVAAWRMVRKVFDMDRTMLMRARDAREAGKRRREDKELVKGRGKRGWKKEQTEGQETMTDLESG